MTGPQISTGVAWSDCVQRDRADNIETAIACFHDALQIFRPEKMLREAAVV
jgi:hypothetical protein